MRSTDTLPLAAASTPAATEPGTGSAFTGSGRRRVFAPRQLRLAPVPTADAERWPPVAGDLAALVAVSLFVAALVVWLDAAIAPEPLRYQHGEVTDVRW